MDDPTGPIADYPFNDFKADLTLRSSEGMSFLVRKAMISLASPVFEDMLTLPDVGDDGAAQHDVVDLPETTRELRLLLEWCDPRVCPQCPLPLSDIPDLIRIADKYQVSYAPLRALPHLHYYIPHNPFRVYLIACRFFSTSLRDLAQSIATEAAERWVYLPSSTKTTFSTDEPELEHVSAKLLQALYGYREACLNAAHELINEELFSSHYCKNVYTCQWLKTLNRHCRNPYDTLTYLVLDEETNITEEATVQVPGGSMTICCLSETKWPALLLSSRH
jgi:hypothetical protein